MKTITLTRKEIIQLLYSLKGDHPLSPMELIKNNDTSTISYDHIPSFIKRLNRRKEKKEYGLSTNEIVQLGNLCELTSLKSTSIQNWIKRDVKELIGNPALGKKYSIEQVAILLIVRDLKAVYDFETIRHMLTVLFNTINDREDDIISPLSFYKVCATVIDHLDRITVSDFKKDSLESKIRAEAKKAQLPHIPDEQWVKIENILIASVLALISSHLQRKAQLFSTENILNINR